MEYKKIPFELGNGIAKRASIGLLVLATDNTIEYEWRKLVDMKGVAFFETRVYNDAVITTENLIKMEADIAKAAQLICPDEKIHVFAFGCTSGALVIGSEKIAEKVHETRPGSKVTDPFAAFFAAMKSLNAKRIGLITPYVKELNEKFVHFIESHGIEVAKFVSFEHSNDIEVSRINEGSLKKAVREVANAKDIDAIFVSCTSLLMQPIIFELESELNIPITSSNHAMAWHALRLADINDKFPEKGKLFTI